jgi:anionic cell wall polymer biosynthesis LytR-Cps2A-Psr (LCP) family protein
MLSGLRNFFLAFLIALVVCGVGASFVINYITEAYGGSEIEVPTGEDGEPVPEYNEDEDAMDFYRFTALIIGIDNGDSQEHPRLDIDQEGRVNWPVRDDDEEERGVRSNRDDEDKRKEADMIVLIDINARTREVMTSYLPRDMRVNVGEYALRLGAVYSEHDAEMLVRTVFSYTGVQPDFYCVLDYDSIISLFDILGRVDYNVPVNMHHLPTPYDFDWLHEEDIEKLEPEIDLRAGFQRLDGEQIIQLLRFKGYGGDYRNEETSREDVHKSFMQEVIRQKFTFENLSRAREIYDAVIECIVETNMTEEDFDNYTGLIFSFSEFNFIPLVYPGNRSYENGVHFFIPNHSGAIRFYSEYRR